MKKYVLYGRDGCGYCVRAKALFESEGIPFEYKDVNEPGIKNEVLTLNPKATTLPQIFVNDTLIGGYDQLVIYINEGKHNEQD